MDNLYKWLNTLKGGLTFRNKHNGILAKQVNLSCKESFIFSCFTIYPRVSLNPSHLHNLCNPKTRPDIVCGRRLASELYEISSWPFPKLYLCLQCDLKNGGFLERSHFIVYLKCLNTLEQNQIFCRFVVLFMPENVFIKLGDIAKLSTPQL